MIVGDTSTFAIESSMTQPLERLGARALGFFVIHVGGHCYGVRSPEATLLACSLDAVNRRIAKKGKHCVSFGAEVDASKVVDAFLAATYDQDRQDENFFGMTSKEFRHAIISNEIVWAPDGDAAFDDGGHVLQLDLGDRVRLIAFKNADSQEEIALTLTDVWIRADLFYRVLAQWQGQFEAEWAASTSKKGSGLAK